MSRNFTEPAYHHPAEPASALRLRLRSRRSDHRISVNVDADVHAWVKAAADTEGVSQSAFIAGLLGAHLDAAYS